MSYDPTDTRRDTAAGNERCPCGSKRKWRKCHGQPMTDEQRRMWGTVIDDLPPSLNPEPEQTVIKLPPEQNTIHPHDITDARAFLWRLQKPIKIAVGSGDVERFPILRGPSTISFGKINA